MNFYPLSDEDVIRLDYKEHVPSKKPPYMKTSELLESLRSNLQISSPDSAKYAWIGEGIVAKVLLSAHSFSGWQEGRISLNVGFAPNQNSDELQNSTQFCLAEEDMCSVEPELSLVSNSSFSVLDLYTHFRSQLGIDVSQIQYYWFSRGIECSVLRSGGHTAGWQSGLVRLQLEFSPKAPPTIANATKSEQSDLNSLRQAIDGET